MSDARPTTDETGRFFVPDCNVIEIVAKRGSLDHCAAYLTLVNGTGADHRTTKWSSKAIKVHIGCRWTKAKSLLDDLIAWGVVIPIKSGNSPRYHLPTARELIAVTEAEGRAAEKALSGKDMKRSQKAHLLKAEKKGFVERHREGWRIPRARQAWLPADLIETIQSDGRTPLRTLMRARSKEALRLLIRLYEIQDLLAFGGVHWRALRMEFDRLDPIRAGAFNVWQFRETARFVFWDQFPGIEQGEFLGALESIEDAGLLEWVMTVVEADEDGADAMFPVGVSRNGRLMDSGPEFDIGSAAREAAARLVGEPMEGAFAIPVERLAKNVQLVGIPRLLWRPRTKMTEEWRASLNETREQCVDRFSTMKLRSGTHQEKFRLGTHQEKPLSGTHQGSIKGRT